MVGDRGRIRLFSRGGKVVSERRAGQERLGREVGRPCSPPALWPAVLRATTEQQVLPLPRRK